MRIWRDLLDVPRAFARDVAAVSRWLFQDPGMVAASGAPRSPQIASAAYDPTNALSSMAAFPWVWACMQAIITDLSGLPLVATKMGPDGTPQIDRSHPTIALMKRPHPQCSGVRFRRQIYADFVLSGEAFIRRIDTEAGPALTRLHPGDVDPEIDPEAGLVIYYKWGDLRLPPEEILHIAEVGWLPGVRQSRGESAIHSLESGLLAARDSRDHARKSAKRGRLEMLLKPTDIRAQLGPRGVSALRDNYERAAQDGSGVLVVNRAVDAVPLNLSPKELEFSQLSHDVRDETLAAFGVPPVRVGLPGANYGTARAQMRMYWERLRHIAALLDSELSRLTPDGAEIAHDFGGVDALQTSATERQSRAAAWVSSFGMSPADAAGYEGFHDAPPMAESAADVNPKPSGPAEIAEEPQEGQEAGEAALAVAVVRWLDLTAKRYQAYAAAGEIPDRAENMAAVRLAGDLVAAGYPSEVAYSQSVQVAGIVHDAVSRYVRSAGAGSVSDLTRLRAFSPDHARRIAAQLGRAA